MTRSASRGFLPLRHRFLTDYLAARFERDDLESGRCGQLFKALHALERLRRAHRSAPAWRQAMLVLAKAHDVAGGRDEAHALIERCREQEWQLAALLTGSP